MQAGNGLLQTYDCEIRLDDLPFTPKRRDPITVPICDPIGAALSLLLDSKVAGECHVSRCDYCLK